MSDHHHNIEDESVLKHKRTELENKKLEGRVNKLENLLIEQGIVSKESLRRIADIYENDLGPLNGAKVIARAWSDESYKERLLDDATKAINELGFSGLQGEHMVVVENTATVHNVVVCTLCSCYPWPVLGLPPTWYKNAAYRSRVVINPRSVLEEFGLELEESVEVRVWDSSAEIRYLVLPERPQGTFNLKEDQLVSLVTREAMIGVAKAREL
ncbi:MAG: nitrile hydratase subunit alpha [Gammaproteobacteria bacterium]|nr:nitrile hydratase subunit alpha [Gammaproteobacteria bacterium]|tara:strand:+ start:299 stop:937 length:639 start_codon:yes stop_codon:yes gene_type:complete